MKDRQTEGYSNFLQMIRIHTSTIDRLYAKKKISPSKSSILILLYQDGAIGQRELMDRQHVSSATMSVMLSRMEKEGLVERQRNEVSAKEYIVNITDKGVEYLKIGSDIMDTIVPEFFSGFTSDEITDASEFFNRIYQNHVIMIDKHLSKSSKKK